MNLSYFEGGSKETQKNDGELANEGESKDFDESAFGELDMTAIKNGKQEKEEAKGDDNDDGREKTLDRYE